MLRILLAALFTIFCCTLLIMSGGESAFIYLDIPTLLIVLVFPLFYQLVLYGPRRMGQAFSLAVRKNPADSTSLKAAADFFSGLSKAIWCFALMGVLIGLIQALSGVATVYIKDGASQVPDLFTAIKFTWLFVSVALLSLLYAAILQMLLVVPFRALLRQRLYQR